MANKPAIVALTAADARRKTEAAQAKATTARVEKVLQRIYDDIEREASKGKSEIFWYIEDLGLRSEDISRIRAILKPLGYKVGDNLADADAPKTDMNVQW
jgi:hypothetical protein